MHKPQVTSLFITRLGPLSDFRHACDADPMAIAKNQEVYDPYLLVQTGPKDTNEQRLQLENKTLLDIISKILAQNQLVNESFEEDSNGPISSGYSSLKSSPAGYSRCSQSGVNLGMYSAQSQQALQDLPFQPLMQLQENPAPNVLEHAWKPPKGNTQVEHRGPTKYYGSGRFCRKPVISALL